MSVLNVHLADNGYDIHFGYGNLAVSGELCAAVNRSGRAALITNPTVNAFYGNTVRDSLVRAGFTVVTIEIPDGEQYKNSATLADVYDGLIAAGLDRTSLVVALGGGVVGDLAGFAAATYLRGVPFVQLPTTLLAQVDSSVGGKTAVDHPRGKNLIGAFYQPRMVLIDVKTLETLPARELRAGLAEVIKYGIAMDRSFFEYLERHCDDIKALDRDCLVSVIRRCCELKAYVVEHDERESGLRAVLNYGHTLGHAFELLAGYQDMVHGEAVAVGMVLAAKISASLGHCSSGDVERITALITSAGLAVEPPRFVREDLLAAVRTDKKNAGSFIKFICNRGIGDSVAEMLSPEMLLTLSGLEVSR